MKINWKIVAGLLAAGWTYDTIVMFVNRSRFHKLQEENETLRSELKDSIELQNMYARKLNQHKIRLTPFERIIMHNLVKK